MINDFNKKTEAYLSKQKHSYNLCKINSMFIDPENFRFADVKYSQNCSILYKREVCDKSVFLYRRDLDLSLYGYPLTLLATNRMTNTLISRQPSSSTLKDLSLIRQSNP